MKKFLFQNNVLLIGCLFYIFSSLLSVISNVFIKKMMIDYSIPAWEAIAIRQSIIVLILIPFMIKERFIFFNWNVLKPNLIRNVIYTISIGLAHVSFLHIPINEGVSLQFITPVLASILAIIFLNEKKNITIWLSLLICIIGALIIQQPAISMNGTKMAYFVLALSIVMKSIVSVLNRILAIKFSISTLVFYTHTIILLVSLCFSYQFIAVKPVVFIILGFVGILYLIEYLLIYKAQSMCPVTIIQPLDFSKIIYAIILSNIVLGEKLTINQSIGSFVILFGFMVMTIGRNKSNKA